MNKARILILGISGMLGHSLFRKMIDVGHYDVFGTVRDCNSLRWFPNEVKSKIIKEIDLEDVRELDKVISSIKPDYVINCVGLIKQLPISQDPIAAIKINSLLPHQIAIICRNQGVRMIHVSTDCVFDGKRGHYTEKDISNADDLYGKTKSLGEVAYPHCVTLRTSIIGHELRNKLGLVEWFLSQEKTVKGYKKAIYSGFPTIELARIIGEYLVPFHNLHGLYHVSSDPISKYELLKLIASRYGKNIDIEPDEEIHIDRSLDSSLFRSITGYNPPSWPELIDMMYQDYIASPCYHLNKEG